MMIRINKALMFLFLLLTVNAAFSGVDFSLYGLPAGITSILDFVLKILVIFLLVVNFKINSRQLLVIIVSSVLLLTGMLSWSIYYGAEIAKVISFAFNLILWIIIYVYAQSINDTVHTNTLIIKTLLYLMYVALALYILAYLGFNTKVLGSTWLYDDNFRFSGTFNEPSLCGFIAGLLFIYFLYAKNSRAKWFYVVSMVGIVLLTGAKFTILILPVIIIAGLIARMSNSPYRLRFIFIIGSFIAFLLLPIISFPIFEYISLKMGESASMSFVTRFGFPITALYQLADYPFGTGLLGYKSTLIPYINQYCSLFNKAYGICDEMASYTDLNDIIASQNFAPKDILSYIVLSYGSIGLFVTFILSIFLSMKTAGNNKLFSMYSYVVLSALFVLPFRFIFFIAIMILITEYYNGKKEIRK